MIKRVFIVICLCIFFKLSTQNRKRNTEVQQEFSKQVAIPSLLDSSIPLNSIIIFTEDGQLYCFDYTNGNIIWSTNISIKFENWFLRKNGNPFIPIDQGNFIIYDEENHQYDYLDYDDIDNIIEKCICLAKNFFVFKNDFLYLLDLRTGQYVQLNQNELLQLFNSHQDLEKMFILSIEQKYIVNLKQSGCEQYNSKISLTNIPNYKKKNASISSQKSIVKLHQIDSNTLQIIYENRIYELMTDTAIFSAFKYIVDEGIFSEIIISKGFTFEQLQPIYEANIKLPSVIQGTQVAVFQEKQFHEDICSENYVDCIVRIKKKQEKNKTLVLSGEFHQDNYQINVNLNALYFLLVVIFFCFGLTFDFQKYKQNIDKEEALIDEMVDKNQEIYEKQVSTDVEQQNESKGYLESWYDQDSQACTEFNSQSLEYLVDKNKILGLGSNGTKVYQCTYLGQVFAVKRIKKDIVDKEEILKEIKLMMQLRHHNLVQFHFYRESNKYIDLVLEKCENNLEQYALNKNKLTALSIQKISQQCLEALKFLQQKRIVHRDIKPGNILFDKTGVVKLADFGISKCFDKNSNTKNLGTFGWRAKEVILKNKYSTKSDIFSLGCCLYYLVTDGQHPFQGKNQEARIVADKVPNIQKKINDKLLVDLLTLMIQNDVEKRPNPNQLLQHPYFWNSIRKINLICELSDYIETYDDNTQTLTDALDLQFQEDKVFSFQWNQIIYPGLLQSASRHYNYFSSKHLIRLFRNSKNHYHELKPDAQEILGRTENSFIKYWEDLFPNIFYSTYKFSQKQNLQLLITNEGLII